MSPSHRWWARLVFGIGACGLAIVPTGPSLYRSSTTPPRQHIAFDRDVRGETHIFVMNTDGMHQADLSRAPAAAPAWSSDGTKLAFVSSRATVDVPQLYVMRADGSHQVRLTHDTMHDGNPTWSPDGTRIAFEGENGLFIYTLKTRRTTRLTNDNDAQPAWSPDGTMIAFTRTHDVPSPTNTTGMDQVDELWVVGPDGSGARRLTSPPISFSGPTTTITGKDDFPAWSPDGRSIVFESNRDSNNGIFLMGADGSNIHPLTHPPGIDESPTWSADGATIVFVRTAEPVLSSPDQIYAMSADGSGQRSLTGGTSPAWQPTPVR